MAECLICLFPCYAITGSTSQSDLATGTLSRARFCTTRSTMPKSTASCADMNLSRSSVCTASSASLTGHPMVCGIPILSSGCLVCFDSTPLSSALSLMISSA